MPRYMEGTCRLRTTLHEDLSDNDARKVTAAYEYAALRSNSIDSLVSPPSPSPGTPFMSGVLVEHTLFTVVLKLQVDPSSYVFPLNSSNC
jgi:hypothetical protein